MSSKLLLAFVASITAGCGGLGSAKHPGGDHALLGAVAPDFEVAQQNGDGKLSLELASGKVTIIDFWATWCEPCKASFPAYQKLADKYPSDVVVLALSVDDDPGGIARFVGETHVRFPVGWDDGKRVSERYEPPSMPTSFVLDRGGVVRHVHAGFRAGDESNLDAEVAALVKGPASGS